MLSIDKIQSEIIDQTAPVRRKTKTYVKNKFNNFYAKKEPKKKVKN